jgi:hypothetical protein
LQHTGEVGSEASFQALLDGRPVPGHRALKYGEVVEEAEVALS